MKYFSALCLASFLLAVVSLPIENVATFQRAPNQFSSWTFEEKKSLCGTDLNTPIPKEMLDLSEMNDLPETFDSRVQWPTCISDVRNQGKCGSCWAFGAAESFTDRLCISTNGTTNVVLSPEDLVACDKFLNKGCNGGIPFMAWEFMSVDGLVSDQCLPYTSGDGSEPKCTKKCTNGDAWAPHKVKLGSVKHYGSEAAIQSAIMSGGPVEAGFEVYEDFMEYSSGVYVHSTGKLLGGHAVRVVGWGVDAGQKYWTVINSWGKSWGENGTFRILRGTNECGIESGMVAGTPAEKSSAVVSVGQDSKLCVECKKAADAIVNKLINLVFQGTVVGGCADLCGHLEKQTEQKICDGLCVLTGEAAFMTLLQEVQLQPENVLPKSSSLPSEYVYGQLCYDIKVCKH